MYPDPGGIQLRIQFFSGRLYLDPTVQHVAAGHSNCYDPVSGEQYNQEPIFEKMIRLKGE
jgi:hypothetical protein